MRNHEDSTEGERMRRFGLGPVARLISGGQGKGEPSGLAGYRAGGTIAFSFVIDGNAKLAFGGYHLAHSLLAHCAEDPDLIHIQVTPEVSPRVRSVFAGLGCRVHEITRLGDGRYCNKIAQLENLQNIYSDQVVLLDTDTIAVADLRPFVAGRALQAKVVDWPNPSLAALEEIARRAGMRTLPGKIRIESGGGKTYVGNCNGGYYAIPRALIPLVSAEWRRWANWLLENDQPLRREGKQTHIDQVAMWLAIHIAGIPYVAAPSNVNYYVHFTGAHRYYDHARPIALLHYHGSSLNVLGQIEPSAHLTPLESEAVKRANAQIASHFDNRVFWDLRYAHFPERGSGVGSRGQNVAYKRDLLMREGITTAGSVLDVGCGDLEVLKALDLRDYLGLDQSEAALEVARRARPDLEFRIFDPGADAHTVPAKDWVLCLEVLIHQKTQDSYRKLVDFVASKARKTLVVSGYAADVRNLGNNHMLFFHEPLELSLRNTCRFRSIRKIGEHTDVTVFRCDV